MKKIWLTLLVIFAAASTISAQNQQAIDSIKDVLNKSMPDTTRIQSYFALAEEHFLYDPNLAIEDCKNALNLSSKIDYHEGISTACGWLAYLHEQQGNISEALKYNSRALSLAIKTGNRKTIAVIYNNSAGIYQNLGKSELATTYYLRALKFYKETNDTTGMATASNNIGLQYMQQGKIAAALDLFQRALLFYESQNATDGIGTSLINLGSLYVGQKEFVKAKAHLNRSLAIYRQSNDKYGEGYSLNSLGNLHMEMNQTDSAWIYYEQALAVRKSIDDKQGEAYALKNLGEILLQKNQLQEATDYLLKSHSLFIELNDQKGLGRTYTQLGKLSLKNGEPLKAEIDLKKALSIAEKVQSPTMIRDASQILSQLYREKREWEKALNMYDRYIAMRDSINNDENKKAILQEQFKYEYLQKEFKLKSEQEKKDLIASAESRKQQIIMYSTITGFALAILLLFFVFRNYSNQKRANQLLKETQDQLIQSEKMAAFGIMASRVAHEIQNPLNFVNNFSELSKDLVEEFLNTESASEKKELASELITNLEKINHHGNRAGEIVRQLQEHSRQGTAHSFFEND